MRHFLFTLFIFTAITPCLVSADSLQFTVGGGTWNHAPSGGFQSTLPGPNSNITLQNKLNMKSEREGYFFLTLEHDLFLIPNIQLEQTKLTHNGTTSGFALFIFNGFNTNGPAVVSLDHRDATFYWQPLSQWLNIDAGFTLRKIDSEFSVGLQSVLVNETIPLAYLAAQAGSSTKGLSLIADVNLMKIKGNSIIDSRVRLRYKVNIIDLEAGLRKTSLKLNDVDNVSADIKFTGLFFGASLGF